MSNMMIPRTMKYMVGMLGCWDVKPYPCITWIFFLTSHLCIVLDYFGNALANSITVSMDTPLDI